MRRREDAAYWFVRAARGAVRALGLAPPLPPRDYAPDADADELELRRGDDARKTSQRFREYTKQAEELKQRMHEINTAPSRSKSKGGSRDSRGSRGSRDSRS